jgi:hypothetical protein
VIYTLWEMKEGPIRSLTTSEQKVMITSQGGEMMLLWWFWRQMSNPKMSAVLLFTYENK